MARMSNSPIRYGIVGTGMMGCEHIRNLVALPGSQVTALADPHPESHRMGQRACATQSRPVEIYSDPRELIRNAPVDALVIATPNHSHAEILESVFESELHILVGKPLCTPHEDCQRVTRRARPIRACFGSVSNTATWPRRRPTVSAPKWSLG